MRTLVLGLKKENKIFAEWVDVNVKKSVIYADIKSVNFTVRKL
jgi:hypothetical protein